MIPVQTIIELIQETPDFNDISNKLLVSANDLKKIINDALLKTYGNGVPIDSLLSESKPKAVIEKQEETKNMIEKQAESKECDTTKDKEEPKMVKKVEQPKKKMIFFEDDDEMDFNTFDDSQDTNVDEIFNKVLSESELTYSDEQVKFMKTVILEHKNVALLAAAGYGKSAVLETTMKLFKLCQKQDDAMYFEQEFDMDADKARVAVSMPFVQICATTGRAALLIKARTIHSLLGIGLARGKPESWYRRVSTAITMSNTYQTLLAMRCLIIDEVSMLGGGLMNKISDYLKLIKKNDKPFGGIQVILVGDFAQLPPINDIFVFNCKAFKESDFNIIQFTKCFRQVDPEFKRILDNIRFGDATDDDLKKLRLSKNIDKTNAANIKPTFLRSTNKEVDEMNDAEMKKLCLDTNQQLTILPVRSNISKSKVEKFCSKYAIPLFVEIAIGAQVMLTFNISRTLVNGTLGIVKAINKDDVEITLPSGIVATIPYIGFKDPDCDSIYDAKDEFMYMPLRVAYAISIHKSQGMTIPYLEIDAKRIFASGQLYVALSRAVDMKGLVVRNLFMRAVICNPEVKKFYSDNM